MGGGVQGRSMVGVVNVVGLVLSTCFLKGKLSWAKWKGGFAISRGFISFFPSLFFGFKKKAVVQRLTPTLAALDTLSTYQILLLLRISHRTAYHTHPLYTLHLRYHPLLPPCVLLYQGVRH